MFIHRVKFKGHVKLLLRASYRIGGSVKKYTIANVTKFSADDLAYLEELLKWRRASLNRQVIDVWIFDFLLERVRPDKLWRLQSKPSEVVSTTAFDFRPWRAKSA